MFDSLLSELLQSILEKDGFMLPINKDFSEKVSNKNNACIQNWLWSVSGFRRWRITSLNAGESLQVLNSVAYPDYTNEMPLMGVDLLWFGKKNQLVAVLDYQPLLREEKYLSKYYSSLRELKSRYPQFAAEKDMHIYDPNQYFSPWILFCRGGLNEAQKLLPDVFRAFLDSYWKINQMQKGNASFIDSDEVKRLQIKYDIYSAERDPAHGLFSSYFGKQWSDRFMKEFLFVGSQSMN